MPLSPEHKEILLTQSESKTLPEWEQYFNGLYSKKMIYDCCHNHKKKVKPRSVEEISKTQSQNARKYHINQDYFKTWSHNMAYIFYNQHYLIL